MAIGLGLWPGVAVGEAIAWGNVTPSRVGAMARAAAVENEGL